MFDKVKQLMDMQNKMQQVKRQLENTVFEVESSDGSIRIEMDGSQKVRQVKLQKEMSDVDKTSFESALKDVYNKAIKRSHELAADEMKKVSGFNIPGL
ncbi:MAG: YbaB/EbfC family DNA-binding protein [Candidatus Omnitrophota bacterium]|jgi:DNA-binding protein YbaB|nr:MAG: YbaB/EbfC family DNA-binding protein [Candidatus Omnitrophota bacterium]